MPFRMPPKPKERRPVARRIQSPRYAAILALLTVVLFATAALLLVLLPWRQTAFGEGQIVAYAPLERQQVIEAPFEGRVVEWHVKEGSQVALGDPVARVRDLDPKITQRLERKREAMRARLAAAEERSEQLKERVEEIAAAKQSGLVSAALKVRAAQDRIEAARQRVDAARAGLLTAEKQLARKLALVKKGLTSQREAELAMLGLEQAKAGRQEAEASLSVAHKDAAALAADRSRLGSEMTAKLGQARASLESARGEVAKIRAELTKLRSRLARQRSQEVVAPRAGTILRLVATQGTEIVKGGERLAILVPDLQTSAAELWMDGRDVPLVHEGQEVRLQFEGWPALQIAGWPSLAIGTFVGRVALIDSAANKAGRVRVLVVPAEGEAWPADAFMRQGMLARGWVLLGKVPLGWELWRLFNGFPPQLEEDSPFLGKPKAPKLRKPK